MATTANNNLVYILIHEYVDDVNGLSYDILTASTDKQTVIKALQEEKKIVLDNFYGEHDKDRCTIADDEPDSFCVYFGDWYAYNRLNIKATTLE